MVYCIHDSLITHTEDIMTPEINAIVDNVLVTLDSIETKISDVTRILDEMINANKKRANGDIEDTKESE